MATVTVPAGQVWTFETTGETLLSSAVLKFSIRITPSQSRTFGPFGVDTVITTTDVSGSSVAYQSDSGPVVFRGTQSGTALIGPQGSVMALSEVAPVSSLTATGTAQTGAGFYRGIKVRAIDGGPQTITVYDATSATGTPIDVIVVNALGTWLWDRPSDVLPGIGGRRPVSTGVHVVISGGTSRTIDVMVEAA